MGVTQIRGGSRLEGAKMTIRSKKVNARQDLLPIWA